METEETENNEELNLSEENENSEEKDVSKNAEKSEADNKAEADKKAEAEKAEAEKAEADKKASIPEKYDLKLSKESLLSNDDIERISRYAREKGLTQEQAVERLSEEEKIAKKGADAYEKKQQELLAAENKRWIEAGMADSEIGGDKYKESAELAKRVVEKFGTKELMEGLDNSGLGNYHEFVKMMSRIGRAMDNDRLIIGDQTNKQPKDIAERMYGGEKKE
jgi:hypothetical protein